MAYDIQLAERIRKRLEKLPQIEEKDMMGGLTFMYHSKMCIGIIGEEMMCRIDPAQQEAALAKRGSRMMDFTGRPMKGYLMVNDEGISSKADFEYWIDLCLAFNVKAKSSKKKQ